MFRVEHVIQKDSVVSFVFSYDCVICCCHNFSVFIVPRGTCYTSCFFLYLKDT
nr:MAG TPA: hypothetical protein [Microviridae sp.]